MGRAPAPGGGICAALCGALSGNVTIISCYNSGKIEAKGGGICSAYCCFNDGILSEDESKPRFLVLPT